ncbi:hypothetical protein K490DRAFT_61605 [Saccharata proteae CBS 121410]|uniref:C2H2-type domain-containing protein n=1 Tax=Saccharata proteae CBS 121410 TaxID=1314787 RepID=A0A9P4I3P8_9PEZI|nr:hypothetical protein K490DRAFT_61605 [Saccharata proteae CBS 121410]
MTATRDISRPTSQHRISVGSAASSLPARQSRVSNHSTSLTSINPAHRVSRRKSMSTTAANNVAAMAAVAKGDAASMASRRTSKSNLGFRGPDARTYGSVPNSMPNNGSAFASSSYGKSASALGDGPSLASIPDADKSSTKARIRRASEGSQLREAKAKRASGSELKCEKCGKGYKHSSCLTKHLWEHTPEWSITSKLLISKHQQVQLLEAASVLVNMNQEAAEAAKGGESDHSSASPAASGSSDYRDDGLSSAETTPPPQGDDAVGSYGGARVPFNSKRFSSNSSAYSHSYQSGNSVFSESVPHAYLSSYGHDGRPTTANTSVTAYDDEDQADLAAAVGLLSCSYGTPQSKPLVLPADVPPVPPLPARYLGQSVDSRPGSLVSAPGQPKYATPLRSYSRHVEQDEDVDMDDDNFADEDDFDNHSRSRGRSDEDEECMFGRMEE